MNKTIVVFYQNLNGQKPVLEFLLSLSVKQRAKIIRILETLEEYGVVTANPHLKKLSNSPLWEIRILGKDNIRIIYIIEHLSKIVLLHGFIKKRQKTSSKDLNLALNRYKERCERKGFDF